MLASGNKGRVNNDNYDTCPNDLRFMLSLCSKSDVVWDPFVGDGFSQRYMNHLGYATFETDVDFFSLDSAPEVTKIVTNPPFSEKQRVVKHLITLGVDFIMLLPSSMITRRYFIDAIESTIETHEWNIYQPTRVVEYHNGGVLKRGCPFNSMFVSCIRRPTRLDNSTIRDVRMSMLPYDKQMQFQIDGDAMGEDL